ncbi:ATP-binding protein [Streptomyces boncukensis]|uniref:ATP-binding protein n=1 Tax=Streptomyces boncukensis TaxID=2711219 RepID=A0A6G4WX74_9ACTN|nr:ATP-binding protein [Streptomyces boncukensis]NGO69124.1 ATP-binding protein [Streptomyces boncukensis]
MPEAINSTPYELYCRLPRTRKTVPRARALLRAATDAWALDADTAYSAQLILSELVTNAIRVPAPVGRQVAVRAVRQDEATLRLSVGDAGDGAPEPRDPAPGENESGYGLFLVAALAHRWGTEPRPCGIGKDVWAELRAPASEGEVTASALTVRAGQRVRAHGAWRTVRSVRSERFATGGLAIVLGLDDGPALRVPATHPLTVRPGRAGHAR